MRSDNTDYLAGLDHLRFFAAALVVLFHTKLLASSGRSADFFAIPLIDQGHVGVPLFMVISGFIMTTIFIGREIEPKKFYANRVLRIYPLFVLIVGLGYFALPEPRSTATGIDFLMALLPLSNLYRMNYGEFGGQMWSVAVELQFYLLFPLLLTFQRQYRRQFYVAMIGLAIALRAAEYVTHGTVHTFAFFTLFGNADFFIAGMIAAECHQLIKRRGVTISLWWSLAALGCITAAVALAFSIPSFFHVDYQHISTDGISRSRFWVVWPTIQAAMWGGFLVLYLCAARNITAPPIIAAFGQWSYSTYVWHILVIALLKTKLLWLSPYAFGLLVVLPVTLAISFISFNVIEQPFLRLRSAYRRPPQDHGLSHTPEKYVRCEPLGMVAVPESQEQNTRTM